MEEDVNKSHFKILSEPILIPLRMYLCVLNAFMCYYQNLVLVTE